MKEVRNACLAQDITNRFILATNKTQLRNGKPSFSNESYSVYAMDPSSLNLVSRDTSASGSRRILRSLQLRYTLRLIFPTHAHIVPRMTTTPTMSNTIA